MNTTSFLNKLIRAAPALLLASLFSGPAAAADASHSMLGDTCAGCHGTKGLSATPMPIIAGLSREYLVRVMQEYKSGKRPSTIMGRVARGYDDAELERIATYYAAQVWVSPPQETDPVLVQRGEGVHASTCAMCHSDGGRHMDANTPRIAGQWLRYLEIVMEEYHNPDRKMPHKFMTVLFRGIGDENIRALAHYYAAQR